MPYPFRLEAVDGLFPARSGTAMTVQAATLERTHGRVEGLDLLEALLVLTAFIAPLNLRLFRALTAYDIAVALLAVLVVAGPRTLVRLPTALRVAAAIMLAAGLLSAFRSTYPIEAAYHVLQFAFVFFVQLPVILTLARSRRVIDAVIAMFVLGYLAVIAVSLLQPSTAGGRVLPFYNEENANALGLPTVFLLPFVLCFALREWRGDRRPLVLFMFGGVTYMMVWALAASASRGSTAASIVSLTVFTVCSAGVDRIGRVLLRIGVVILVILALGVVLFKTDLFGQKLEDRIVSTFGGQEPHEVTDERAALNRAGINEFLQNPFIGTGFDNFRYVSQFYDDEATFHDPHNLWIQFLAQTGIVGAAAFAYIIIRWFVLLLRTQSIATDGTDRQMLWAFIAAMMGIMAHSMLSPLVLQRHYWILYGLGISLCVLVGTGSRGPREPVRISS
jgi:O-antigen ligase